MAIGGLMSTRGGIDDFAAVAQIVEEYGIRIAVPNHVDQSGGRCGTLRLYDRFGRNFDQRFRGASQGTAWVFNEPYGSNRRREPVVGRDLHETNERQIQHTAFSPSASCNVQRVSKRRESRRPRTMLPSFMNSSSRDGFRKYPVAPSVLV